MDVDGDFPQVALVGAAAAAENIGPRKLLCHVAHLLANFDRVAILEVTVLPSSVASPPSSRPPALRAFDALAETWEDTPTRVLVRGDARRDVLEAKLLEGASVAMLLDEAPRRGDVYSLYIVGPVPETAASRDEPPQGVGGSFAAEARPELFGSSSAPFGSSATRLRAGDLVPARRGAACDKDERSADSPEDGDREDDASSEGLLQQGVPAAGGSGSGSDSGFGSGSGSGGAGAERVRLCAEVGYAPAADAPGRRLRDPRRTPTPPAAAPDRCAARRRSRSAVPGSCPDSGG